MDLPAPPSQPPAPARAPANGLKLMLVVVFVFAGLAAYGQWEHFRRAKVETVTIVPTLKVSPARSPNEP
jgi:hypothetical protein